jgi:SAM-dependent methyltransferase
MKPRRHSDPVERTLDYYDSHAEEFLERTATVSIEHLYEPFLALVPQGGRILDAGCGSGRDAAEFARRGYEVVAFDDQPRSRDSRPSELVSRSCI